jgi:hypothetical protein
LASALSAPLVHADIAGYPSNVEAYDPREVAMLPRYCIHTQLFRERVPGGSNAAEIKRWTDLMGPAFDTLHHYCWGLMKTNRALILARTAEDRRHYLADSLREFEYVIERAPPEFVLLPEILTKRGENLLRQIGGRVAGVESLHQRQRDSASGRVTQPLRRASRDLPVVGSKVVHQLRNVHDETVQRLLLWPGGGCRFCLEGLVPKRATCVALTGCQP